MDRMELSRLKAARVIFRPDGLRGPSRLWNKASYTNVFRSPAGGVMYGLPCDIPRSCRGALYRVKVIPKCLP